MPMPWETEGSPEPKGNGMPWENATDTAVPDGFQPTQYGFKVRPIDLGNGKQTVQREDGAAYFGPEQGNTGKPGWGHPLARIKADFGEANRNALNDLSGKAKAQANMPILGQIVPAPVAGMTKGFMDTAVAPLQLAAHLGGSSVMDPVADAIQQNYEQNWQPSKGGEVLGQALPFVATMGGSAAVQAPTQALTTAQKVKAALATIAKASGTGAVAAPAMTTETGVQGDADYWKRKQAEALTGAVFAGGLASVAPAVAVARAAKGGIQSAGKAPAAGELLDELGARLGGKAPGEALQDAAHAKYNAAWDEFKAAVAPVDAEAGKVAVDYGGPVEKLKQVLGVGQRRPPTPLPKERQEVLEGLLKNLEEAGKSDGMVDNSFQGAIDTIKWLGSEQRRLAVKHGDTEARQMLGEVRDSILKAMEDSSPELSQKAQEARRVFATKVAPLFDKSEGGNFLTQIRDTPTPGDLLGSANQGALTRMKPDRAAIIAKGSSADPLLYSYLDAAIKQGDGKPGSFVNSLNKAMPAIEAIGDPKTVEAFKGVLNVAKTAKWGGMLANIGLGAAVPGHSAMGATAGVVASFNPAYSGPGLLWKLMQTPGTRKLLSFASKLPAGSPELELIAKDLSKSIPALSATSKAGTNITPFRPATLPAAADTGNPDTVAQQ